METANRRRYLTPREAQIIARRIQNPPASYSEIGKELGISRQRAQAIAAQIRQRVGLAVP
jgi:DNA-directed RNA polymerase sigma subunit (sigma70/sigma32)